MFSDFLSEMNLRDKCSPEKKAFARHLRKNMTLAEDRLWQALRRRSMGHSFKPQRIIRGFIVDFYCPHVWLIIEVDGSSHDGREQEDAIRDQIMSDLGFLTLRFSNQEVLERLPDVLFQIGSAMNKRISEGIKPLRGDIPEEKRQQFLKKIRGSST